MRTDWKTALAGAAAAMAAGASAADASPWNRDPGDHFTISRTAYFAAEGGEASLGTARRFEQVSAEFYAEYGASDRVMAGGKLIYAWQQVDDPFGQDSLSGFAEAEGFAQVQVARWEGGALALMATANAPTRTSSRVTEGRAFERDARIGAAALAGFDLGRAFATLRAGPDLSLGDDAHTLRVEGTLGRRFGERGGLLLGEAYLTQSLGGAGPEGADFTVLRAGPSVILPFWGRTRVQLGGIVDVAGRDVDLGASAFVAFWVASR